MATKSKQTASVSTKTSTKTKGKSAAALRRVRQDQYRSFRLQKRIKHRRPIVIGSFRLFGRSLGLLRRHWRLFGGIVMIHFLLSLVLVRGFGATADLPGLKEALGEVVGDQGSQFVVGVALAGTLFTTSASPTSSVSGAYQTILLVMVSLATIWALRQVMLQNKIRIRDSFYKGMYPLTQFVLVLLALAAQLIPIGVSAWLYQLAFKGGLATTAPEQVLFLLLIALLTIWSIYMVTATVFALYIVTLPDMTPIQAIKSARGLVQFRRWTVMRKVLFLPVAIVVLNALIMFPLVLLLTPIAELIFYLLTIASAAIVHTYMYTLYRELIS